MMRRGQLRLITAPSRRPWPGVIRLLVREHDPSGPDVRIDAWGRPGRPQLAPVCECPKPARQRNEDGDLVCIRCGKRTLDLRANNQRAKGK